VSGRDPIDADVAEHGAPWTAREIRQQPQAWREVEAIATPSERIRRLLSRRDLRILLTGAGSSAYIGDCLAPAILARTGLRAEAVPTTDLVSGPRRCFQRDVPTLVVSFARSGNSPESVAALRLADAFVEDCHHLVLTCNAEGELARTAAAMPNAEVLLMPPQTHDRSFAMTSSFTSMLLAAARIFDVIPATPAGAEPAHVQGAIHLLAHGLGPVLDLAGGGFERVIYVGSNELKGLAREGALKLLELTDGQVPAAFESSLGLRHGPKTLVNGRTLVVLLVSNDPSTRPYDLDLLRELRAEGEAGRVVALFGGPAWPGRHAHDIQVDGLAGANDLQAALAYAVFVQMLAMHSAVRRGFTPDNPSVSGTVHRVVRGVTIHPAPRG